MKPENKTVLIVGIDSFTGKYIAEELAGSGYVVHGTVMGEQEPENHHVCDIMDRKRLRTVISKIAPDYVVHLAARSFVGDRDEKEFYNVNVFGTLNLLDVLIENGHAVKKIVLAGSSHIYGSTEGSAITENVRPNPNSHYALSKYAMEQMARNYCDRLDIAITRPFNYTGLGQSESFIIPKIVAHFRDRRDHIELGNIDVARDFSDVRDVARAYRIILESSISSDVINICSSEAITIKDIIAMAQKITGHEIELRVNHGLVRASDIKILKGDNSRLRALGYSRRYAMKETMKWMLGV